MRNIMYSSVTRLFALALLNHISLCSRVSTGKYLPRALKLSYLKRLNAIPRISHTSQRAHTYTSVVEVAINLTDDKSALYFVFFCFLNLCREHNNNRFYANFQRAWIDSTNTYLHWMTRFYFRRFFFGSGLITDYFFFFLASIESPRGPTHDAPVTFITK